MFQKLCCGSDVVNDVSNEKGYTGSGKTNKAFRGDETVVAVVQKEPVDQKIIQKMLELKIRSTVFKYLTVNELITCRLVSKAWNREACKILRHKIEGVVILQRGMDYYVKLMSKSLDVPVGRVFLKLYDMNNSSVQNFFEVIGHSIVYLILNLEGANFPSFVSKLHCLKNLKELSVNLFYNEDIEVEIDAGRRKGTVTMMPMPSIQIIVEDTSVSQDEASLALPSLESIVLSCEPDWKRNDQLSVEKMIRYAPNLRNLNLLKWPFPLNGEMFAPSPFEFIKFLEIGLIGQRGIEILSKKNWTTVKSIQVEFAYDIEPETFADFLESASQSLEYIEIRNEWSDELPFALPVTMKELLTIRLTFWKGIINIDSIVANAPKIDKLQLSRVSPANLEMKDTKLRGETLRFLAVNYENTSHPVKTVIDALKSFVALFPNVTFLMMKRMTDKLMGIVFEGWPKLEMLSVTTTFGFSDSGLTGIPMMDVKTLKLKPDNRIQCGCFVPPNPEEVRVNPFIGRLKYLKDLRLESEVGTKMVITNLSLHMGIQYLSDLRSLKIISQELGPSWCLRTIADSLVNLKELVIMDRAISNDRYNEQDLLYLLRARSKVKLTFVPTNSNFSSEKQLTVPGIPLM